MLRHIIRRPIAVSMCVLALAVIGVLSMRYIPVSLMPDIDIPQITVHAAYPGASVRQVESRVTGTLRGQLSQVPGLKDIGSESRMDAATVTLTFEPGADMDLLFIEVGEKIDRAMTWLPKEMERPKVVKASAMDIPAFYLDISLKDSTATDMRFVQLSSFARNVLRKRIEQLPQTAMVDMSGMAGTEIVLTPRADRMEALGLTPAVIEQAIKARDVTLSSLSIVDGIYRYNIHFDAALLTVDDIKDIILAHDGRLLRLGELCDVTQRPLTGGGIVRHDGRRAVTMAVVKQTEARMEELQAGMDTLLTELRAEFPEIAFDLTRDQTRLLTYSMDNLRTNLLLGAALACLVLFVFMRSVRLPLLIIISIPLSLILTVLSFHILGISLNVISLSGLILGVGMIVDNSIIVIDNIRQRMQHEPLDVAVVRGSKEVFQPMLSSVLTTCSVFIPLVFLSGTAGELFYDQAMAVTIALFASLLVAVAVIPVYFRLFHRRLSSGTGREPELFMSSYSRVLGLTLRHARWVLGGFALCVACAVMLFGSLRKEQLPDVPHEDTMMAVDWNLGISEQENDLRMRELLGHVDSLRTSTTMVGTQSFLLSHTPEITSSEAIAYLRFGTEEERLRAQRGIEAYMADRYPRATVAFTPVGSLLDMVFGGGESRLSMHLQNARGGRPTVAQARAFTDSLRNAFPMVSVQPVASDMTIEYRAQMERMALYGVTYDNLLSTLRGQTGQRRVFGINDGADVVPVLVGDRAQDKDRVMASSLTAPNGVCIPLHLLVATAEGEDFKRLHAASDGDYYPIDVDADDATVRDVMAWAQNFAERSVKVDDGKDGVSVTFFGDYFSSRRLVDELLIVLSVALALLYFILAAQFENLVQPLIILSEMVVDVAVVLVVLWLAGESLNIMSMIGLVVMSGIIINDSILKVDTINRLRRAGTPTLTAIVRAGHRRLRPIIMTSLTTILAILPLLSRADMGSALQYPLSLTLIVGMTVGTMVSLFFVPLVYKMIYK